MICRIILRALLLATLAVPAAGCAGEKQPYDLVVQAQDCTAPIRMARRVMLPPQSPTMIRLESLERRSVVAMHIALVSHSAFHVSGSFLTECGDVTLDVSAPIGEAAVIRAGGLWVSITLAPAGS